MRKPGKTRTPNSYPKHSVSFGEELANGEARRCAGAPIACPQVGPERRPHRGRSKQGEPERGPRSPLGYELANRRNQHRRERSIFFGSRLPREVRIPPSDDLGEFRVSLEMVPSRVAMPQRHKYTPTLGESQRETASPGHWAGNSPSAVSIEPEAPRTLAGSWIVEPHKPSQYQVPRRTQPEVRHTMEAMAPSR